MVSNWHISDIAVYLRFFGRCIRVLRFCNSWNVTTRKIESYLDGCASLRILSKAIKRLSSMDVAIKGIIRAKLLSSSTWDDCDVHKALVSGESLGWVAKISQQNLLPCDCMKCETLEQAFIQLHLHSSTWSHQKLINANGHFCTSFLPLRQNPNKRKQNAYFATLLSLWLRFAWIHYYSNVLKWEQYSNRRLPLFDRHINNLS